MLSLAFNQYYATSVPLDKKWHSVTISWQNGTVWRACKPYPPRQLFRGLPAIWVWPTFSIAKVRRTVNATSTGILRKPISRIFHWQPSTVFCKNWVFQMNWKSTAEGKVNIPKIPCLPFPLKSAFWVRCKKFIPDGIQPNLRLSERQENLFSIDRAWADYPIKKTAHEGQSKK